MDSFRNCHRLDFRDLNRFDNAKGAKATDGEGVAIRNFCD